MKMIDDEAEVDEDEDEVEVEVEDDGDDFLYAVKSDGFHRNYERSLAAPVRKVMSKQTERRYVFGFD